MILLGPMVTTIAGMEYTSDGNNLQHFGFCIGFCLCMCVGCIYRLMSTAVYNQFGQQFHKQLPVLKAAI